MLQLAGKMAELKYVRGTLSAVLDRDLIIDLKDFILELG